MSDDIIKRLRDAIAALNTTTAYALARSDYDLASSPDNIAAILDRLDTTERENERLREWEACAREWLDKTEWVQKEVQPKDLGRHRADVMRDEIERLREEVFALSRENELLQEDVDRYRWLKSRLLCADFEYVGGDYKAETVIVFKWPEKARVSNDLSSAIDAAMAAEQSERREG